MTDNTPTRCPNGPDCPGMEIWSYGDVLDGHRRWTWACDGVQSLSPSRRMQAALDDMVQAHSGSSPDQDDRSNP